MAWCFLGWAFALFMGSALAVILIQRAAMQGLVLVDELIGFASCRQFDLMLERRCQKYHCRDNGGFALLYLDLIDLRRLMTASDIKLAITSSWRSRDGLARRSGAVTLPRDGVLMSLR